MFYHNELQFFCDTLKKSGVNVTVSYQDDFSEPEHDLESLPLPTPRIHGPLDRFTMYKLTDSFDLCYIFLLLPDTILPTVLMIGPYLTALPTRERLLELGEKRGVSPSQQSRFDEYYLTIPVLSEGDHLFVMINTFCERIWKRPAFAIVDINNKHESSVSPINATMRTDTLDDITVSMITMEKRYAFENELIRAVTLGQLHKEEQLLVAFSAHSFENRLRDPIRNAKNYCIIMNTLLRKAAENGGVHPVYIDRVSSELAAKIEQMSDISENVSIMRDIFRSYCRLVRKHAMTHYSPVVQKVIFLIDSDLSADLSLKSLAGSQNVSPGYLSSIFRKDTGKTISEYIRKKRIDYASYLLATTNLQIQTVALHCGIIDVQYFSKIFKKETGKTPKEYRETANQPQKFQ